MTSSLGGNLGVVSLKSNLTNPAIVPMQTDRFLVVDDTREVYFDDGTNRYKLRDVQIFASETARINSSPFAYDLVYVAATNKFWFYDGTQWVTAGGVGSNTTLNSYTITGTGSVKSFTVSHGFNNIGVLIQVIEDSTGETVYPNVSRPNANSATITFKDAPVADKTYTVIVIGDASVEGGGNTSRLSFTITGTGNATEFSVLHNLDSNDVMFQVVEDSTGETIFPIVTRTSTNSATITFYTAPELNKTFTVIVIG